MPMLNLGPDDIAGLEQGIAGAITPAFLLTGIFAALNVLAGRLSRLVDRERDIREGRSVALPGELARLVRRARCAHRAILSCVVAAILLCVLIIWAFLGALIGLPVAWVLAALLIGAMGALMTALVYFLVEVRLAAHHLPLDDSDLHEPWC